MKREEFRDLTAKEEVRAAEQPQTRTKYEKMAYRLLPPSLKAVAEKNPEVAFYSHAAYYPDLFFYEDKFLVEIDGFSHIDRKNQDKHRNWFFANNGYSTIRIRNHQVCNKILFWTKLEIGLLRMPKEKRTARIECAIRELDEIINTELIKETMVEDYDEEWFKGNAHESDYHPYLFYNI